MTIEDTLDAFVDGEAVDTASLDAALTSPEGRAYLIDALALRRLVESTQPALEAPHRPSRMLTFAKAAALAIAFAGLGYAAGLRQDAAPATPPSTFATDQTLAPPEPTRVIELTPGVNWHESKGGD